MLFLYWAAFPSYWWRAVEEALLGLFSAACEFNDNSSLSLFDGLLYDFESGSTDGWDVWGLNDYELPPLSVEYEAFCGRYALEVSVQLSNYQMS